MPTLSQRKEFMTDTPINPDDSLDPDDGFQLIDLDDPNLFDDPRIAWMKTVNRISDDFEGGTITHTDGTVTRRHVPKD